MTRNSVRANVFWHFKTLNPSELSDYITLTFQETDFASWLSMNLLPRETLKRLSDLLFVIMRRLILPNVPTSREVSVKAKANQTQM